jgi:glycosyltransferase involved in cell wall biosynthesis
MTEVEDRPFVSFVLPAYNEGEAIGGVLERLDSAVVGNGFDYEVLVVDDGSKDDTRMRASQYAIRRWNVRVLGYDRNVGKGFAIRTGYQNALGDAVVFLDSDSDVDVKQVERYVRALRNADIVIGSKRHPSSEVEAPLVRRFLSLGFNVLVRLLTGIRASDTQTGIKAVRKEAFERVFRSMCVKRYAFDVELLAVAGLYGLKVVELPVRLRIGSRFSALEVCRMLQDVLGIAYRLRIKKSYDSGL